MRDRRTSFSSTVNKELNRLEKFELTDCTLAFIVFSNNIKHSLIQLAVQKKAGVKYISGDKVLCCLQTRYRKSNSPRPHRELAASTLTRFHLKTSILEKNVNPYSHA